MSIDAMRMARKIIQIYAPVIAKDADQTLDALDAAIEAAERQEPKCHATETLCSTCNNDFRKCVRFHPPQPAIPDGWQLVPKALSAKMSHRMGRVLHQLFEVSGENDRYSRLWFELLDAAPKPGDKE